MLLDPSGKFHGLLWGGDGEGELFLGDGLGITWNGSGWSGWSDDGGAFNFMVEDAEHDETRNEVAETGEENDDHASLVHLAVRFGFIFWQVGASVVTVLFAVRNRSAVIGHGVFEGQPHDARKDETVLDGSRVAVEPASEHSNGRGEANGDEQEDVRVLSVGWDPRCHGVHGESIVGDVLVDGPDASVCGLGVNVEEVAGADGDNWWSGIWIGGVDNGRSGTVDVWRGKVVGQEHAKADNVQDESEHDEDGLSGLQLGETVHARVSVPVGGRSTAREWELHGEDPGEEEPDPEKESTGEGLVVVALVNTNSTASVEFIFVHEQRSELVHTGERVVNVPKLSIVGTDVREPHLNGGNDAGTNPPERLEGWEGVFKELHNNAELSNEAHENVPVRGVHSVRFIGTNVLERFSSTGPSKGATNNGQQCAEGDENVVHDVLLERLVCGAIFVDHSVTDGIVFVRVLGSIAEELHGRVDGKNGLEHVKDGGGLVPVKFCRDNRVGVVTAGVSVLVLSKFRLDGRFFREGGKLPALDWCLQQKETGDEECNLSNKSRLEHDGRSDGKGTNQRV